MGNAYVKAQAHVQVQRLVQEDGQGQFERLCKVTQCSSHTLIHN